MLWRIISFPKCVHHIFLSHCQEDRDQLVLPIHERLQTAGVVPWLDQEDYYYGRDSRTALRDGILRSRHIVFFVTEAMLNVARGWCVFELAYAELLDVNLRTRGGQLANPFLPLFLLKQDDVRLPRSVWQAVRERGRFFDSDRNGDPIEWCANQIRDYLLREQVLSKDAARLAEQDSFFATMLAEVPGLQDRVAKFQPKRIR